jgi:hypothetical protein
MSKRFSILLVVLTIVSGLVGGAITGRIFTPKVAIAEEATQSKILTVEELRVVDKSGKLLMTLGKAKKAPLDCYGLFILNNSGETTSSMHVDESGSHVFLLSKDGSVGMHAEKFVGGNVILSGEGGTTLINGNNVQVSGREDEDGKSEGIVLTLLTSGGVSVFGKGGISRMRDGSVDVYDEDSEGGASMSLDESGGSIRVNAKDGEGGVRMNIFKDGSGHVGVSGKDVKSKAVIGVDESGGTVSVLDKDGELRAYMCTSKSGGTVSVQGKDGKSKAYMSVTDYGNGAIMLLDKNGNKIK